MSAIITAIGAANQYYNPGLKWTYVPPQVAISINRGIARGSSVWCAVGGNSTCATSSDGLTWTANSGILNALSGGTYGFGFLAWNGSVFCAVTDGNRVVTSPDGVNWTYQTGLQSIWGTLTYTRYTLVAAGNTFVLGTQSGLIATSTDGVTWTNRTGLSSTGWGTKTVFWFGWNGTSLLAVGQAYPSPAGSVTAVSSDKGVTWTYSTNLSSILGSSVNSKNVVWANGKWFASGVGLIPYGLFAASSTDGLTWTDKSSAISSISGWSGNPLFNTVVSDGAKIIIAGYDSTPKAISAISRDSGNSWVNNTNYTSTFPSTFTPSVYSGAYGNGSFCFVFDGAFGLSTSRG